MEKGESKGYSSSYEWKEPKFEKETEDKSIGTLIDDLKDYYNLEDVQVVIKENRQGMINFKILRKNLTKESMVAFLRHFFESSGYEIAQSENPRDEGMMIARKGLQVSSIVVSKLSPSKEIFVSVREQGEAGHYNAILPSDVKNKETSAIDSAEVVEGLSEEETEEKVV